MQAEQRADSQRPRKNRDVKRTLGEENTAGRQRK